MYVYCIALLVIVTAPNSESAWEIYRIPLNTVNHGSDTHGAINFNYPSNDVGTSGQRSNDFFEYDNFERRPQSQSYDDFLNQWSSNKERIRTERQQLFPQNPIQTASDINVCIRNCPTTSEYNPVCGSNSVTYSNPSRLECAKFCGVGGTTFLSLELVCSTTSEYNSVCGSNGVTYSNPSRLECANFCGVAVQLTRYSRCPEPGLPTTDVSTSTPAVPIVTPVTPTPVTPSSVTPPVTLSPVTPSPLTNPTTESTTTTQTSQDFTIPQNILDNIFTTNYDIDERHED